MVPCSSSLRREQGVFVLFIAACCAIISAQHILSAAADVRRPPLPANKGRLEDLTTTLGACNKVTHIPPRGQRACWPDAALPHP